MAEELYGRQAEERSVGYEPLPDPVADEAPKNFGNDVSALREAASELIERRKQQQPDIVERFYQDEKGERLDWDPELAKIEGKPLRTLEGGATRAARDLAQLRQTEIAAAEVSGGLDLMNEVDARRAEASGQPVPQPQQPEQPQPELQPQPETPQPEAPQAAQADAEILETLEKNPKLRTALAQTLAQVEGAYQQAAMQVGHATAANFIADVPELRGLAPEQLPGALAYLAQNNPERAREILVKAQRAKPIIDAAAQAHQQQQQAATHEFQSWAKAQDDAFQSAIKDRDPEHLKANRQVVREFLKAEGMSDADIAREWNNNRLFRSATAQRILNEWADLKRAQAGINRAPAPLPPVHKPGVWEPAPAYDAHGIQEADTAFKNNPTPRTAASRLAAVRRARATNAR